MTMRNDIKELIEAIMNSKLSVVEDAVNSACDKVDEIFNRLEELASMAADNLSATDSIGALREDLEKLHEEL